jgi:hypothetical protein
MLSQRGTRMGVFTCFCASFAQPAEYTLSSLPVSAGLG